MRRRVWIEEVPYPPSRGGGGGEEERGGERGSERRRGRKRGGEGDGRGRGRKRGGGGRSNVVCSICGKDLMPQNNEFHYNVFNWINSISSIFH